MFRRSLGRLTLFLLVAVAVLMEGLLALAVLLESAVLGQAQVTEAMPHQQTPQAVVVVVVEVMRFIRVAVTGLVASSTSGSRSKMEYNTTFTQEV
jgi:hypothetical protein